MRSSVFGRHRQLGTKESDAGIPSCGTLQVGIWRILLSRVELTTYKGPVAGGKGLWYPKNRTLRVLVTTMGPIGPIYKHVRFWAPGTALAEPQSEQEYRRGVGRLGFM